MAFSTTSYKIKEVTGSSNNTTSGIRHANIYNSGSTDAYLVDSDGNQRTISSKGELSISQPEGQTFDLIVNANSGTLQITYFV